MKTAIMQPYFLPYIGYWQLIATVDVFVVYDNIQYTKKGWFNRNRYLRNTKDELFSIALKKDSDYLNVNERFISPEFNRKKLIAQFQNAYAKAPYKNDTISFIEKIVNFENDNLFEYIYNSIKEVCKFLQIETELKVSSSINIDHNLRSKDKVIALCKMAKADTYINPIGGMMLYDKNEFENNGLKLNFIKSNEIVYKQFDNEFIPWLSILDIMMFNNKKDIQKMLEDYTLL